MSIKTFCDQVMVSENMKVIPTSKLVEFISLRFDQMIRFEERRRERRSNFNKKKDRKRYEIKSDNTSGEDEKIYALKNWKNTNEYKTKDLILAGKENLLNIFAWQCWYLISDEPGNNDKDIFEWIAKYISERDYLKQNKMSKHPKYTFNDIKRIVEYMESKIDKDGVSDYMKSLTEHEYKTYINNIPIESKDIKPDYELLRSLPPDLDKF